MKNRILIADDESRIRDIVKDFLEMEGYEVLSASDGQEALDLFYENKDLSLMILDVMMPKINGWDVCKEVRETSEIPVILLTALDHERDELRGFESGADDYIAKPFRPKVLMARVQALLRRAEETERVLLTAGDVVLDPSAHTVTVSGKSVDLSTKEYELLKYFMENRQIALSREKILNHVWEYDYFGDDRTIDTHVKKLRSKLGEAGKHIVTVWGVGYKFEL